jgi:hypothetical protein
MVYYTSQCELMLIPVQTDAVVNSEWASAAAGDDPEDYAAYYAEDVLDYGSRGWCRAEFFIFGLYFEMKHGALGDEVPPLRLYCVGRTSPLQQFKVVEARPPNQTWCHGVCARSDGWLFDAMLIPVHGR